MDADSRIRYVYKITELLMGMLKTNLTFHYRVEIVMRNRFNPARRRAFI